MHELSATSGYLPSSIDIRVLGKCNLECPFCFGPRHELRANHIKHMIRIVPELYKRGTRTIVITGGEPLLVRDLPRLISVASSSGLQIILSTNGTLVQRRHRDILPFLKWIALPVDGPDAITHNSARPGRVSSFDFVIDSILLCRNVYPDLKIKMGTVVTRQSISRISDIPRALNDRIGAPDTWRIYQTSYSSYAADNRDALYVSDLEFEDAVGSATLAATTYGWPVSIYRNSERNGKYLFMEPDGAAMAIHEDSELVIGNFFDDMDSVCERWSTYVNDRLVQLNISSAYPMGNRMRRDQ